MSHIAITWAWSLKLDVADKIVLLALADHANHHTKQFMAFPSIGRVAGMTGLSSRHVIRVLHRLEENKILSRTKQWRKGGGRTVNTYTLNVTVPTAASMGMSDSVSPMVGTISDIKATMSDIGVTAKKDSSNRNREPKDFKLKLGKRDFPIGTEFVEEGTPAWKAWASYLGKAPPVVNFGWHFPSKYPPEARQ